MLKPSPSLASQDAVNFVLKNCAISPLLTRDQEITYGRQVRAMMQVVESQGVKEPHKANRAGNERLFMVGLRARDRMMRANLKLVVSIAKKFKFRCTPAFGFEDMIQEGTAGLSRAAEKFNPEKGYRFSTYATGWIRQAITRGVATQGRSVRVPIHVVDKLVRIRKVEHAARAQGRAATVAELDQAALGFGKKRTQRTKFTAADIIEASRSICSLDHIANAGDDLSLHNVIPDPSNTWDAVEAQESREKLRGLMMEYLEPNERALLGYLFGLWPLEGWQQYRLSLQAKPTITLDLAAEFAGIDNKVEARNLKSKAWRKLKVAAKQPLPSPPNHHPAAT
jgi:RNA polymerase nonessential primary-like sigma factor